MIEDSDEIRLCNVCDAEGLAKVASSGLGPTSFAYCPACIARNAEPFMMVATRIFVAVHQRARLLGESRTEVLAEWLRTEAALRGDTSRPVGFRIPEPMMQDAICIGEPAPMRQVAR